MNKKITASRPKYFLSRLQEALLVIFALNFLQGCTKRVERVNIFHGHDGILEMMSNNGICWRDQKPNLFYCPNIPNLEIELKITCEFRKSSPELHPKRRGGDYFIWFSAPCLYNDKEISIINMRSANSHGWGDVRGFRGGADFEIDFISQPPETDPEK